MIHARTCVVIPHAGGEDILFACLRSLASTEGTARVLLVDNASPDDSVSLAQKEFPWLEVLTQKENLGFAGGCNEGMTVALSEPIC